MTKHFLLLLTFVFIGKFSFSQNRATCILGDTLRLNMNNFRGAVTWQESTDNQIWTNIIESTAQLSFVPTTTTKYVRAKIEEENCPAFYENSFLIEAIDTNVFGYSRLNVSTNQIQGQIISNNSNILIFELFSNDVLFKAGDFIYGVGGQPNFKYIDALIINNGILTLYISESSNSIYNYPLNLGEIVSGRLRGYVMDEKGKAIFGAKVKIGDDSVYTDVKGVFQFQSASMLAAHGFVSVSKLNYFDGIRSFVPKEGGNEIVISLLPKRFVSQFSSSAGATVDYGSYQIQIPPNCLTLDESLFNGLVKVRMQDINPDSSNFFSIMPGALWGNQLGVIRSLESMGMFVLEFENTNGQKLKILEDQLVTVSYTLSSQVELAAPDTIDLWSFDEQVGYWKSESKAVKIAGKYVGNFNHFSFWNYDFPYPPAFFHGIVVDNNGTPLPGATVHLTGNGLIAGVDQTNSLGLFGGLVPKDYALNLNVSYEDANGTVYLTEVIPIPPITSDTIFQTITINFNDSLKLASGLVTDCNGIPLENAYLINNGQIVYLNNGEFDFYSSSSVDSFKIVGSNPTIIGQWHTINLNSGVNEIGVFQLCEGDTFVTGTMSDFDQNNYNTVLIGDIWWMANDLRVTHYSNGTLIPLMDENLEWSNASIGGYCYYNNNIANSSTYGNIYNGYAVVDLRNVCPVGWHTPSTTEYLQTVYLLGILPVDLIPSVLTGNDNTFFRGAYANIGGILKSTNLWQSPNQGATNEVGFSAVPNGFRSTDGTFGNLGTYSNYWLYDSIINQYGSYDGGSFSQAYNLAGIYYSNGTFSLKGGRSIRCVKNN